MRQTLLSFVAVILFAVPAFADPCRPVARGEASPGRAAWSIQDCGGLKVVKLSGTPEERSRRYGELMKSGKIKRQILDFFLEAPTRVSRQLPAFFRLFSGMIVNAWAAWNDLRIPGELKKEVGALAETLGVSRFSLERGMAIPDAGAVGAGLVLRPDGEDLPAFGCTSVARALPDGGFAIGRNLDYSGVGIWDKNPSLTIHLPPEGSGEDTREARDRVELRHAAVAADGIHYGSISGFNEAGIAFFLHQAFYKAHLAHPGEPAYFIGEQVLRQAHTLEEAVALLEKHRPIPMWIFVLADLKTGRATVVESSATTFFTRPMEGGILAQANHLRDPKAAAREVLPWSIQWHSKNREELAYQAIAGASSLPELVESVRAALEKQADPHGNLATSNSVLNPETIQSLVLSSRSAEDWQASIGVGAAPVSSGPAVTLSIQELWRSDSYLEYEAVALRVSQEVRERQLRVSHAFVLAQSEARPSEIAEILAPDPSVTAHLARAIYAYRDASFERASTEVTGGFNVLSAMGGPSSFAETLVRDDLIFLAILADWNRTGQAPAPERWQELAQTSDPRLKLWVEKLKGERGKAPKIKLGYQFFTGRMSLPLR